MSTRGLIGIRNNKTFITGYYNHSDSYYDGIGLAVIDNYYDNGEILNLINKKENYKRCDKIEEDEYDKIEEDEYDKIEEYNDDKSFILDGLFCEYAYIHNIENDTLEIYRGFFKNPQFKNHKKTSDYYTHLIIIIDKKIHTKEEVLMALNEYDEKEEEIKMKMINEKNKWLSIEINRNYYENILVLEEIENNHDYPERRIIPFKWNKNCEVCLNA